MIREGSIKSLPFSGLLLPFYKLIKLGVLEMALKLRTHTFNLYHVKFFLGIFFILSFLIKSLLNKLPGSTFIFVKNTPQKQQT